MRFRRHVLQGMVLVHGMDRAISNLLLRNEPHANGRRHMQRLSALCKVSGAGINAENHDIVRILICCQ